MQLVSHIFRFHLPNFLFILYSFLEAQEAYLKHQNKEKERILQFRVEVILIYLKLILV